MLNIVIDARMIFSSGIGTYLQNIIPYMVNNYEVTLIGSTKDFDLFSWRTKVKVIELDAPIYSIKEQIKLYVNVPKCDIFWSPHYNIPILPISARYRIVTIHDVYHVSNKSELSLVQKTYARFMIYTAIKLSKAILTVSDFSKKEIIKYTGTQKKIDVIYNGIKIGLPCVENDRPGDKYILFVGNVKPHKNLYRTLKAFERVSQKYRDIKFYIIGKKDGFITSDNTLAEVIQGLNDKIQFIGFIKDPTELQMYYNNALLFVSCSLYESFCLPPLEAQYCHTPILISRSGDTAFHEIYGDSGLYCDPYSIEDIEEKMLILLEDEELKKSLVQKGLENIKRFSWEKSAKSIIAIMDSLTKKRH